MTTAKIETPADVLADIERRLTALGSSADALNTYNAQAKWAADHSQLVNWRQTIQTSTATLEKVTAKISQDEQWEKDLTTWRDQLNADLLGTEKELAVQQNVKTSLRIIDLGKHADGEWTREIETLPLGTLMRASGYVQAPPAANTNAVGGPLPWYGSVREVEGRLKALRAERDDAQRRLDDVLRAV